MRVSQLCLDQTSLPTKIEIAPRSTHNQQSAVDGPTSLMRQFQHLMAPTGILIPNPALHKPTAAHSNR